MATYSQVIGKWLRDSMAAKGKTNMSALARESEVNRSHLYLIWDDQGNPGWEIVSRIARALGVETPDFALGSLEEPSTVSGLIGQAQNALERAQGLLRAQEPTEQPSAEGARHTAKRAGRVHGRPDAGGKGKGAA